VWAAVPTWEEGLTQPLVPRLGVLFSPVLPAVQILRLLLLFQVKKVTLCSCSLAGLGCGAADVGWKPLVGPWAGPPQPEPRSYYTLSWAGWAYPAGFTGLTGPFVPCQELGGDLGFLSSAGWDQELRSRGFSPHPGSGSLWDSVLLGLH
jgi:hypothetical protein